MDPKGKYFKYNQNKLKFDMRDSYIQVLASDAGNLDGYGSQFFVEDEFHQAKDTKLFHVLS